MPPNDVKSSSLYLNIVYSNSSMMLMILLISNDSVIDVLSPSEANLLHNYKLCDYNDPRYTASLLSVLVA